MKKSFKAIALSLALVFSLSLCLVACDDDKKSSGKATQEATLTEAYQDKYSDELVDIYLLATGVDSSDAANREMAQAMFSRKLSKEATATIDMVGKSILTPAGFDDEYIMSLLAEIKKILEIEQRTLGDLITVYVDNAEAYATLSEKLMEIAGKAQTVEIEPSEQAIIGTALSEVDDLKSIIGVVFDNYTMLSASEKIIVSTALQAFVDEYNKFIDILDATVFAKILVNTLTIGDNEIGVLASALGFGEEELAEFDMVREQLALLGITDSAKKEAYAQFISVIIGQGLKSAKSDKIRLQSVFDVLDKVDEIENAEREVDKLTLTDELIEKVQVLIGQIGMQIQASAMTEAEIAKIENASNVLDEVGLGYFVERFVPAVEYTNSFIGYYLENMDLTSWVAAGYDIYESGLVKLTVDLAGAIISQTISEIIAAIFKTQPSTDYAEMIEDYTESLINLIMVGNDDIYSAVVLFSEDLNGVLTEYGAQEQKLINAINVALGSSFATDVRAKISSLAAFYGEIMGENNATLSADREEELAEKYQNLITYLAMSQADFNGFELAQQAITAYVQPFVNLVKMFMPAISVPNMDSFLGVGDNGYAEESASQSNSDVSYSYEAD